MINLRVTGLNFVYLKVELPLVNWTGGNPVLAQKQEGFSTRFPRHFNPVAHVVCSVVRSVAIWLGLHRVRIPEKRWQPDIPQKQ